MKELPIGLSDYKELIDGNYYYVDKTLCVKELQHAGKVVLIPRPRRFGKTLNLSMLRYFYEKTNQDTSYLFQNKKIWQEDRYKVLQGQYPVIFITFKDVKEDNWEKAYQKITDIIRDEFMRHSYLRKDLSEWELKQFDAILSKTATQAEWERALLLLSALLKENFNKKVIILIDEYDAPIHAAYIHNYYATLISFMRSILSSAFKDNDINLERGVMTGILRTAKEGIFSGLNNLDVCSLNGLFFTDTFGFTEPEVKLLLKNQKLSTIFESIRDWYDGYTFGQTKIYNPWSVIQCAYNRGLLKTYWLNTSDNALIKRTLTRANAELKSELELLITGHTIIKEVEEGILIPNIENNDNAIWSLLLFSGYLTYSHLEWKEAKAISTLKIPNNEVKVLYADMVRDALSATLTTSKVKQLLQALIEPDAETFQDLLQEFMINSISSFDLSADEPEKSYHVFILGLLVQFSDQFQVKSNRESGYGRYDIMLIPRIQTLPGIVLEFKKVFTRRGETLENAANNALEQIKNKNYSAQLKDHGVIHINLFGIAFEGKKVMIAAQEIR